jgi:hypothetical protein
MVSSILKTVVVVAAMVISRVEGSRSASASSPSKVLVLEGTVASIGQISHERTPWLVTVTVKRVVAGEFSGPTFSFAVHSPAQSGLEKGRPYTVEAIWKDGGYVVDEFQWRRGKRIEGCIVPSTPANMALQRPIRLPRFARAAARR